MNVIVVTQIANMISIHHQAKENIPKIESKKTMDEYIIKYSKLPTIGNEPRS